MKEPFYPAEWAIKILSERLLPPPIHGNIDLNTKEAREYYSILNKEAKNETSR